MKTHTQVAVIGGGVVGASILYHLTKLGWSDVLLLEKAQLTSGSSWHAAGGFHALNGDTNMAALQGYTIEMFKEIERISGHSVGLHQTGNLYLAADQDRLDYLRGERGKARYMGLASRMVSVDEALEICPLLNPAGLVGAMFDPDDGHIDPTGVVQALAQSAQIGGAEIYEETPVLETRPNPDGTWRLVTPKGDIQAEVVVNAGGLWGREVAAQVGIQVPILPMEHQYIVTDAIADVRALNNEIPMVIDFEGESYLRQEGDTLLIGTYEQESKHWAADGTPDDFVSKLLEPDMDRLMDRLEMAFDRYPCLASAGVQSIINGPMVFAPDGNPIIGPVQGVPNYFLAVGIMAGFSQGAGVGQTIAEWIIEGEPNTDVFAMDATRFGDYALGSYTVDKTFENYSRRFAMTYPNEELPAGRPMRTTPAYDALKKAGAVYGAGFGLEYPLWFATGGMEPVETLTLGRSNAFEPVAEECQAVRERVGLLEIANYAKYEVSGPGAAAWLDNLLANKLPRMGRVVLAPMLSPKGKLMGDFSVARLGESRFILVGSGGAIAFHSRWFNQHLPDSGVDLINRSDDWPGFGISGPRANDVLAKLSDQDVSTQAFRFFAVRELDLAGIPAIVARVSFTGELGYEIYAPRAHHLKLYQALQTAGSEFGMALFGSQALDSLRLEKGFGSWMLEYTPDYDPYDSGLGMFVKLDKGEFIGQSAAATLAATPPARTRCVLLVEDAGRDVVADEAIWYENEVVGFASSGGYGHSVGQSIAIAYLPSELVREGQLFEVEIYGDRRPARLVTTAPYDPDGAKMRVR
jgi:dimethylglycine dehydrogenase